MTENRPGVNTYIGSIKRLKRRVLAFLMVFVMLCALMPLSAVIMLDHISYPVPPGYSSTNNSQNKVQDLCVDINTITTSISNASTLMLENLEVNNLI